MKGISTGYLDDLQRKAVKKKYPRCVFCKGTYRLESHHIFHRHHALLRFDIRNGITVCVNYNPEYKMTCHQFADTRRGQKIIEGIIGAEVMEELDRLSMFTLKDYCVQQGITTQDFRLEKKAELLKVLKCE